MKRRQLIQACAPLALSALLSACSLPGRTRRPPEPRANDIERMAPIVDRDEVLLLVTRRNDLLRLRAQKPGVLLEKRPLQGMLPGESLLGMAVRRRDDTTFGLSDQGRVLHIDLREAQASAVGAGQHVPFARAWGLSIDPDLDMLRALSDNGRAVRVMLSTGAPATQFTQQAYAFMRTDLLAGVKPRIVALGTRTQGLRPQHYAIDANSRYLCLLGHGGSTRLDGPDAGVIQSIGPLLIEPFDRASLDIDPFSGNALLVTQRTSLAEPRLYDLNLDTGQARMIGALGFGEEMRGMVLEP